MSRRNRAICTVVLALGIAVLVAGCDDAYKSAAKASDDVASSVTSAIDTTKALYDQQLIDQGEKNGTATILGQITTGNQQFRGNVRSIHARGTATKADYLAAANDFVGSARTLLQSGSLHVKNASAQQKVDAALQAIQTALTGIITAIQGAKS